MTGMGDLVCLAYLEGIVVSHPWYCSYLEDRKCCISNLREAAETWL